MIVAVAKETFPGERRVALVPAVVASLTKAGLEVLIESGAGQAAGFSDAQYAEKGAKIAGSRAEAFAADCLLQVRSLGANPQAGARTCRCCGPAKPSSAWPIHWPCPRRRRPWPSGASRSLHWN